MINNMTISIITTILSYMRFEVKPAPSLPAWSSALGCLLPIWEPSWSGNRARLSSVGCQFCWWSDALTASSACSLSLSKSTRMTWVIKGSCDEISFDSRFEHASHCEHNTMKGNNLSRLPKGTRGWHIRFHMHGVEVGIQRVHVPFHHFRHLPLGTTLNASPRFSSTETWA